MPDDRGQFMTSSSNGNISALLAICAGNSPITAQLPSQRPVARSFDVFFDLRLNKRLSKQRWGWWFETLSLPIWRHCNVGNPTPGHISTNDHTDGWHWIFKCPLPNVQYPSILILLFKRSFLYPGLSNDIEISGKFVDKKPHILVP